MSQYKSSQLGPMQKFESSGIVEPSMYGVSVRYILPYAGNARLAASFILW